jgi:hypothetical protein
MFYIKSKKPELTIKRQAERLFTDWTRPILRRTDDYRKKEFAQADYDPRYVSFILLNFMHANNLVARLAPTLGLRLVANRPQWQLRGRRRSKLLVLSNVRAWSLVLPHTLLHPRATLCSTRTHGAVRAMWIS